jgi:uncharacterized secreted repeat protein (TIGR03808 family)
VVISRRNILKSAGAFAFLAHPAYAAMHTVQLQALIDKAKKTGGVVSLAAGVFETDTLLIDATLKIEGVFGRTVLKSTLGQAIFEVKNAENVFIDGIVFDSQNIAPNGKAGGAGGTSDDEAKFQVLAFECKDIHIENCIFRNAETSGLGLDACTGRVIGNQFYDIEQAAILAGRFHGSYELRGLLISGNHLHNIGNNGIVIEHAAAQSEDDGSIIIGNIIDGVRSKNGTGQHGNGIYVFASDNVIVSDNRVSNTDYSGIRNTSSKQVIIRGNMVTRSSEVAIFVEYAFESAVVDGNIVDQSFRGIELSGGEGILGFNGLCSNNIVRNTNCVTVNVGAGKHIGINVTAINTVAIGNVIETVGENEFGPGIGLFTQDWKDSHSHMVQGNMVYNAPYGIGLIIADGATPISVLGNTISKATVSNIQLFDASFKVVGGDQTVENSNPQKLILNNNLVLP